jgi:DnaJ-class molecular chaperone
VEVAVEIPTQLSERARQLIEDLGKEMGTELQPQRRTFLEKLRDLFG